MAVIVNGAEVLALAHVSRIIPRIPLFWVGFLGICVFVLACGLILEVFVEEWALGDGFNPPNGWLSMAGFRGYCFVVYGRSYVGFEIIDLRELLVLLKGYGDFCFVFVNVLTVAAFSGSRSGQ
jgi:hypothetical protein